MLLVVSIHINGESNIYCYDHNCLLVVVVFWLVIWQIGRPAF